jgi:3-deoxy-D-manno-octulosonate 8-phosphate phosphatase (KDO 8-P phosphatase)
MESVCNLNLLFELTTFADQNSITFMFDHSTFVPIKAFIFDVDGVLTDGKVLVTEQGEFLRSMSVRDGQAMKIAIKSGYSMYIITKGASVGVRKRLEILGITGIYDKLPEKVTAMKDILFKSGLQKEEILYMGDDLPDLALKPYVGVFACPNDAVPEVLASSDYISSIKGGDGCVRDVIEKVLKLHNNWYNEAHL